MPEQEKERVTEDQAFEALQQLTANASEAGDDPEPQAAVLPSQEPEPPAEEASAETETEAAQDEPAEVDDVASLKARLAEKDEERKKDQERLQDIRSRYAANEEIRTQRYLKKATAADRARQILAGVRTDKGLTTEDVEKAIQVLEDTMNPASPSYAPAPEPTRGSEEQAIILNDFLNEQGMTATEAEAFGTWVQREGPSKLTPRQQSIAGESLIGFLDIAHRKWRDSLTEAKNTQRQDTVDAVKTVQRTQKQAAKAASAAPSAPLKQPATPKRGIDTKKMTKDDVAALLRQSVEQYR